MLWFLDWSVLSFLIVIFILMFVAFGTGNMPAVFCLFVFSFFTTCYHTHYLYRSFSLYPKEYYSISEDSGSTLGELWCNYTEYNGELCKNYVAYVLKNQKITALEKQIKLEKEKAQKDKIRANYEKTLKEIVEKGDTQ